MLCRALRDAGHDAMLLAAEGTLQSARDLGVPHAALAGDIRDLFRTSNGDAPIGSSRLGVDATAKALARVANENVAAWMHQALECITNRDTVICSGLAAFAGLSVAEKLGIPALGAGMIPLTPTSEFPSAFMPPRQVPRLLNRFSHRLVTQMLWWAFRKATNRARVEVCNLPPRRKLWSAHPMLYGISPSLLPRPADWPSNAYMCGQWVRPVQNWDAPAPLRDFLAAGEAPIFVGFGSMVGFDRSVMRDAIVAAVGGRRTLFYPGWSGPQELRLPGNFCVVGDTPHNWLFPRTSLVIHHGGSGTTHSAAAAGVPSVVLPFAGDQPFWAERLWLLGVASESLNGRDITARSLERAINAAGAREMRTRAAALGERMASEDGLASAVATVESLVPHHSRRNSAWRRHHPV
jgi:sterol 3beta-glucosyltransferase